MNIKQLLEKIGIIMDTLSFSNIFKYALLTLIVFIFALTTINSDFTLTKSDTRIAIQEIPNSSIIPGS